MAAAARRGQEPLNLDLPNGSFTTDSPPISALFLIYFDIKAGYTIGWKRSLPSVDLEGVVEYKSLPSGLHTVKEDLIYYVHDNHAGLSAFINAPAAEESRNARMIAVGIMVPLSYGRLGRSWKHAESLKRMARELVVDTSKTQVLEDYWEAHKAEGSLPTHTDSFLDSPTSIKFTTSRLPTANRKGHTRQRSASDGATLNPASHNLSAHHPAWSLLNLLETFGPLIFPIHRAALLRKRILLTGHAPVEETCNFVYDISVLSNIPLAVEDLLASTAPPQRLRPLFSIGVHDIPYLEEDLRASKASTTTPRSEDSEARDEAGSGWIACTTDSILAMKSALYDVLITMPPPYSEDAVEKVWPKIESPQGTEMRATQRDLRRYKTLRWGLSRHINPPSSPLTRRRTSMSQAQDAQDDEDIPMRMSSSIASLPRDKPMLDIPDTDSIIEPLSWSALAYAGFMWWASAGEQRLQPDEENDADADLLSGLSLAPPSPTQVRPRSQPSMSTPSNSLMGNINKGTEGNKDMNAEQEMAIIAYFHRLTTQILSTISDIVDTTDSDDERDDERERQRRGPITPSRANGAGGEPAGLGMREEARGGEQPAVYITTNDVVRMGLDVWSATDHQFIVDMAGEYFGCRARVEGRSLDICGVRIC